MVGMEGVVSLAWLCAVSIEAETEFGGHFEASENPLYVSREYPFTRCCRWCHANRSAVEARRCEKDAELLANQFHAMAKCPLVGRGHLTRNWKCDDD